MSSLALLAKAAGYEVSGSDKASSINVEMLESHGIEVSLEQTEEHIAKVHERHSIDWLVASAAIPDDHPEIKFADAERIKRTKRDDLLNAIIAEKKLPLVAVSGTHGKTTTSSMMVWISKELGINIAYAVGSNPSFGPSGDYQEGATCLIIEADEYDRNMLKFNPYLAVIVSLDFDHPDTYADEGDYLSAFSQFASQSEHLMTWESIAKKIQYDGENLLDPEAKTEGLSLRGKHNRNNAYLAIQSMQYLNPDIDSAILIRAANSYPGVERRFEQLSSGVYSDYAHHPVEIEATIQLASEQSENVVVVYQPHQNVRQHHIKDQYTDCFLGAKKLYWLPTYLTREPSDLELLTPDELTQKLANQDVLRLAELNDKLKQSLESDLEADDTIVVFMGAGNIDDWARQNFQTN